MHALYPKRRQLHSILLLGLLAGCESEQAPVTGSESSEAWPNEHEVLFQEAEALKFSLEQSKLEAQRLRDAQVPVTPPAPR